MPRYLVERSFPDGLARRPTTENRVEKAWRQRRVTAQQPSTADATRRHSAGQTA